MYVNLFIFFKIFSLFHLLSFICYLQPIKFDRDINIYVSLSDPCHSFLFLGSAHQY